MAILVSRADNEPTVLVAGGGVGGLEVLLALRAHVERGLRVTLLSDRQVFVLRPQLLGEPWGGTALRVDVERLTEELGVRFHRGTLTGVDAQARRARLADGAALPYDELIVAVGACLSLPYPQVQTIAFGPLPHALAEATGELAIVVPPGTGWTLPAYQLALLAAAGRRRAVTVVTPEETPLERFGRGPADAVADLLDSAGVTVRTRCALPTGLDVGDLADTVVALPLQHGPHLDGLRSSRLGGIEVDGRMRATGVKAIHVVGDATAGPIKQGGLASQQAETSVIDLVHTHDGGPSAAPAAPVLRGLLAPPGDGPRLYLRRVLDGVDDGAVASAPLWTPGAPLAAPRLVRWLDRHHDAGQPDPRDVVPTPR